jgi:hypothetical protein
MILNNIAIIRLYCYIVYIRTDKSKSYILTTATRVVHHSSIYFLHYNLRNSHPTFKAGWLFVMVFFCDDVIGAII